MYERYFFFFFLAKISQSLIKEVEKEDNYNSDAFGNNGFSMNDMDKKNDKDEDNPLSGYDLFDLDKS